MATDRGDRRDKAVPVGDLGGLRADDQDAGLRQHPESDTRPDCESVVATGHPLRLGGGVQERESRREEAGQGDGGDLGTGYAVRQIDFSDRWQNPPITELRQEHIDILKRYARAKLPPNDRQEAEDVVQVAILRTFANSPHWLFGQLFQSVRWSIADYQKKRTRALNKKGVKSLDFYPGLVDSSPYAQVDARVDVERALDGIYPPFREALLMGEIAGGPVAAAEVLGIPANTAMTRLFKGRRAARKVLEG